MQTSTAERDHMVNIRNTTKQKLASGDLAIGVSIRQARTVDIAKAMKTAGFDWLFIDMEHNSMDIDMAVQISVTAQETGITPLVRVPGFEHFHASRVLDGGAQGIVVPHVDDKEVAQKMDDQCKYPHIGHRSVTGAQPMLDFENYPMSEATEAVNAATFLVIMLETSDAISNVDEIASVPGVDALLIGTNDLCMELNIPGQLDHPSNIKAYEATISACKKNGKYVGMGGIYSPDLIEKYVHMGVQMVLGGSDLGLMISAGKEQTAKIRNMIKP